MASAGMRCWRPTIERMGKQFVVDVATGDLGSGLGSCGVLVSGTGTGTGTGTHRMVWLVGGIFALR